jgi:hypothetical protein
MVGSRGPLPYDCFVFGGYEGPKLETLSKLADVLALLSLVPKEELENWIQLTELWSSGLFTFGLFSTVIFTQSENP